MKSRAEIATETQQCIPRPIDYVPHAQLEAWDATLPATSTLDRDAFIRRVEPMHDRILVQLLKAPRAEGAIQLTDPEPLIGGCRKAVVLKTGPGKWIEGEWWFFKARQYRAHDKERGSWEWFPGYRRPISVIPGQVVLIGNWVDLEVEDIALCQEGDVRVILPELVHDSWPN